MLVAGALSSAAWVLQWAFSGGGDPQPDVEAIVSGLVALVESVSDQPGEKNDEPADSEDGKPAAAPEPVAEPEPEVAPEPVPAPAPEPAPTQSAWDMDDVPRPHFVR